MLLIVSGPVPVLVNVTTFAPVVVKTVVLAYVRLLGETPATGTPIPVPVSVTICFVPVTLPALSVTVSTALRLLPGAVGSKVTEMEQFDPAPTELPQVFAGVAKEVAFVPLIAMLATANAVDPELLRVMVCVALVLFTF
jgi:hypothetical protein